MNLGILNIKKGNLKSLLQILNKIDNNINLYLINNLNNIDNIDKIILSGQTNSLVYLNYLLENNFIDKLINFYKTRKVLGICSSFQLNFLYNQENNIFCLNNNLGVIKKFLKKKFIKYPYIGWNKIKQIKFDNFNKNYNLKRFYFSNSFYLNDHFSFKNIYFISKYFVKYPVLYNNLNLTLTQFHPEKSGNLGLKFFKNFIKEC